LANATWHVLFQSENIFELKGTAIVVVTYHWKTTLNTTL